MENSNTYFFKFELSYILIPVLCSLYIFFPLTRPYLLYTLIYISLIGTYNTLLLKNEIFKSKVGIYQYWGSILFHLILLISLFEFNKYGYPNLVSFIIMIIGILILTFLPYWPYYLSREYMIYSYIVIYFVLSLIFYIIK